MINLDSILKSRVITLLTKVHIYVYIYIYIHIYGLPWWLRQ